MSLLEFIFGPDCQLCTRTRMCAACMMNHVRYPDLKPPRLTQKRALQPGPKLVQETKSRKKA